MLKVFLAIALVSASAMANFFSKKDLNIALGAQASSLLYKRGIITYGGHQITPILSVTLFNPNLLLAGSALYYKHALSEKFFLRTRINTNSTLDRPLYYTDEREGERVQRDKTSELDFYFEYINDNTTYMRLQSSTDLVANNGQYFELYSHLPVFNFSTGLNKESLFLLGAYASIGYGDLKHNEYLYGDGASGWSLNNYEVGLTVRIPKVIDIFWPTFKLSRFEILGQGNRNASFVEEKHGWAVELLAAFRVY